MSAKHITGSAARDAIEESRRETENRARIETAQRAGIARSHQEAAERLYLDTRPFFTRLKLRLCRKIIRKFSATLIGYLVERHVIDDGSRAIQILDRMLGTEKKDVS